MNERIKELSEQAEKYADDNFRGEPTWSEAFESKFAELIVRECANLCKHEWNGDADTYEASNAYNECADLIKDHFGVKE